METRANYFVVGVFVLVCMVGLVVAVLWLAGAQYREEYVLYESFFPGPVTGLGPGTIVRYNGIEVGSVRDVHFDPDDPRLVIAIFQVSPEVRPRTNSVASLETQGLTGVTFVQMSGGTPDAAFLTTKQGQQYPVIPARASALQQLSQTLPQLLERLNGVAENGRELLNADNREAVSAILVNIQAITAAINARTDKIDAAFAQFQGLTERLEKTLETTDDTVMRVGKLATTTEDKVKSISVGELDRLLIETRATVTSLNRLASELERQPTGLLFGDRRPGYQPQ